ncbi:MAG: isoprenylcysteine carboxylmethyltransferase family protein [Desulfosarcina sp.]|nr:isoprenylcysteine carboxylmethyltransferase family protein [Desulfobacterales bacterium]
MKFNSPLFKTLLIGPVFVGIVAFLIPLGIFIATRYRVGVDMVSVRYLGLIPFTLGAFVSLWCVKDFVIRGRGTPAPFDPPTRLVLQGPYRYVRNPMYVGLFFVLIGEALLYASFFVLLYSLFLAAAAHIFVIFYEEPTLRRKFGERYEQYLKSVPRWRPRLTLR